MGDVFKEQLVKREPNIKNNLIKGGVIGAALLIFLILSAFNSNPLVSAIFPFIFLALIGGAYFVFTMQNVEYEYIYTNGELDIDRITNRSRRKRIFSSDIRAIEIVAHIEDKNYSKEFENTQKTMDFSSGKVKPNTYVARVPYGEKMVKLIIEPNETIQQAMVSVLSPRKFHIKN